MFVRRIVANPGRFVKGASAGLFALGLRVCDNRDMTIREELEAFFVTPIWVAEYWGVRPSTVFRAIESGALPAHVIRTAKRGKHYKLYVIDVRDLPPRHVDLKGDVNGRRRRQ